MKLITKKDILNSLYERWKSQYITNHKLFDGKWSFDIIKQLEDEQNLTEERAIEIIGNKSWTMNICDECSNDVYITVQIGQKHGYDSVTANICLKCLNKAVKYIDSYNNQEQFAN